MKNKNAYRQFKARKTTKTAFSPVGKLICKTSSISARSAASGAPKDTLSKVHSFKCSSKLPSLPVITRVLDSPSKTVSVPSKSARIERGKTPLKLTRTLVEESFHLVSFAKAVSGDTVMFLWIAKEFGLELASRLALEFQWKLRPSLQNLRAMWVRGKITP